MVRLHCGSKMHGILIREGVLEIKCDSRLCGAGNGHVILHKFSVMTGEMLGTEKFTNPEREAV